MGARPDCKVASALQWSLGPGRTKFVAGIEYRCTGLGEAALTYLTSVTLRQETKMLPLRLSRRKGLTWLHRLLRKRE